MIFFNRILPDLYVGMCPEGFEDILKLVNFCGITAVLNLQTNDDLRERGLDWKALKESYRKLSVEVLRVPMRDFDYEDQRKVLPAAVRALVKLLASGNIIYLHCNVGAARSPLVAMAYLYWCRDFSLREAIGHVQRHRPCSPYEDLLEISRQDLLRDSDVRKEIPQLASEISKKRKNNLADPRTYQVEAEARILKKLLGVD
ncbi:MAG: hypothetical protein GTN81_11920 [Proteobacteria bacterium]|nr:hypothetical protein [Pseudomonadota bacterium]